MDPPASNVRSVAEGSLSAEDEFERAFRNRDTQTMKKVLQDKKVNLNHNERLFLHNAIFNEDSEMTEFILQNGGDPNIRDSRGRTALCKAICNFSPKLVKILLEHNADMIYIEKETGKDAVAMALQQKCWLQDEDFPPRLRESLAQNNNIVYLILKHGMRSEDEIQANYYRLCDAINKDEFEAAKKLVEEGKDISSTALEFAVIENRLKIAELLLVKGVSPNNQSIIFSAIKVKNLEMVKLLCKHKTVLDILDKDYFTPLCYAVNIGLNWVEMLIDHGANPENSIKALHQACLIGRLDIVKLLIKHKADVNRRIGAMNTPLHEAVAYPEIVKLLLENGAEVNARNSLRQTPLDQASSLVMLNPVMEESIKLLKEHGGETSNESWKNDPCSEEKSAVFVVDFKFNKGKLDVDAKCEDGGNVSFSCEYDKFVEVLGEKDEEFPVAECVKRLQEDEKQLLQDINATEKKDESD